MSARRWGLAAAAATVLTATVPALRILPFRRARRVILALPIAMPAAATADEIAWAVAAASRRIPRARTCLPRALAAEALLTRAGMAPVLHVGVTRQGGAFGAHAWTEVDGRIVVGGEEAPEFRPLHRF